MNGLDPKYPIKDIMLSPHVVGVDVSVWLSMGYAYYEKTYM